ncbi:hypothetical protein MO973_35305 [Paenibacillus sp. TRM 82003]|uniref:hypothetical protein n=1 Tax=Kineococcus sp. TRM81007 TaxID=2925831 RepID=UPI001F5913EC|nr:hypothetical protein [Kineococcus sp. TRM81007]MCI2240592.1 hypothetical protein [Kineococcus sp. TRM81007]MCI3925486.1 hypothetical protein [Paenibacillus sp. TRM 82003]
MSTHLLLEGPDLQDLLAQVRQTHGDAARVVRAERIRSGGVAGFFSKERYEVTVEMRHDGTAGDEQQPAGGEALDFEALLAAADRAESEAAEAAEDQDAAAPSAGRHAAPAAPDAETAPSPVQALKEAAAAADDFEEARQGLVEMLKASGAVSSARAAGLLGADGPGEAGAAGEPGQEVVEEVDLAAALAEAARREEERRLDAERAEAELAEEQRLEAELAEAQRLEAELAEEQRIEAELVEAQRLEAELAEAQRIEAELVEAQRIEAELVEAQRIEAERLEAEHREAERLEAARAEAERREAERMQQERVATERLETERREEARREEARREVRRRQAERIERTTVPAQASGRSLGDVLAAAEAADGTDRLRAMLSAGRGAGTGRGRPEAAPQRPLPPHRPLSTEGTGFAATMAAVRHLGAVDATTGPNVIPDVRSVTRQSSRPSGTRPGRPAAAAGAGAPFGALPARTTEDRVTPDQFGAANGVAAPRRVERTDAPAEGRGRAGEQEAPLRGEGLEARRGAPRRPELRRPAPVEDHFGDRFVEEEPALRGAGAGYAEDDYEAPFEPAGERRQAYPYAVPDDRAQPRDERGEPRHEARAQQAPSHTHSVAGERAAHDGDDNEAADMDLTYRDSVTTYSDRPAARAPYREPHDSGDVLRLAREIEVPVPLRVGSGELVVVVGEADAVVAAALLVADEVGSEAPLVLGRADVQNTVTAEELPARQEQARRWSAPLTVAIPARPTGADAERAARLAAEIGAAAVVVCVDATRRSHAVAAQLRALDEAGVPARRLAVHRAAESPDPLDVLSLDVPVGFLDGRPATSGAWAGLLLDATSGGGAAR